MQKVDLSRARSSPQALQCDFEFLNSRDDLLGPERKDFIGVSSPAVKNSLTPFTSRWTA